nr:immunoglobulin light chain junction region [Macaca mulatta]MOW41843.1 immunoglobulin light chain junction region [Macaca mulatta]
CMHTLEFPYTF